MASGFWVRKHGVDTHGSTGVSVDTVLVDNSGSAIQENRELTMMGFYFTLYSATSVLYAARIIVVPEMIDAGDLTSAIPEDDDALVWAKFYAHAGVPGYFQLKSKRTLHPDDQCFVQTFALSGADNIAYSWQSYVVGH